MKYSEMKVKIEFPEQPRSCREGQGWPKLEKRLQGVGAKYWDQFLADATSEVMTIEPKRAPDRENIRESHFL